MGDPQLFWQSQGEVSRSRCRAITEPYDTSDGRSTVDFILRKTISHSGTD